MSDRIAMPPARTRQSYRHEALFWRDREEFVAGLMPFVSDALIEDEPIMVALVPEHTYWLQAALGPRASKVLFVDMAEIGRNPARIIPEWHAFLTRHARRDQPVRGIGEPIWAGRRPPEIAECQLHEALLNLAVDPKVPFWLICPYDAAQLGTGVLGEAHRSHPVVATPKAYRGSLSYGGQLHAKALFNAELPRITGHRARLSFTDPALVFQFVVLHAAARIWSDSALRLAVAARRLAQASIDRGAPEVQLRIWDRPDAVICELGDDTVIDDYLVGRRSETAERDPLYLANLTSDLVQLRSGPTGTTVRLYAWKDGHLQHDPTPP